MRVGVDEAGQQHATATIDGLAPAVKSSSGSPTAVTVPSALQPRTPGRRRIAADLTVREYAVDHTDSGRGDCKTLGLPRATVRSPEATPVSMTDSDVVALAERVRDGELRLYELEDHAEPDVAAAARRHLLAEETDTDLSAVGDYTFDAADAESDIENMVGAAQVPMGVVGPLPVDGGAAEGDHHLPLATSEGALLASVNRGVSTIRNAGGATARVLKSGMTRAPVFRVEDVAEAGEVSAWVREHVDVLADAAESTTSHGELQDVTPYVVGDSVFLRFSYDTKDAMGMNMATIATEAACGVVETRRRLARRPLGQPLFRQEARRHQRRRGARPERHRRRSNPRELVEDRSIRPPTPSSRPTPARTSSAPRRPVRSDSTLTSPTSSPRLPRARAGYGAGRRREQRYHDGRRPRGRPVRLGHHRIAGGRDRRRRDGPANPVRALDVLGYSGGGDPAGCNADALAEVIAAGALAGELSLLAALSSRHLSSAHADLGR